MTIASGALSKLVLGFESAFNTIATEGFELPFVKSTLKGSTNKTRSQVIRGDYNPTKPIAGRKSVSGQVTVPLDCFCLWYWLKAAFNTVTTTGAADPYTHEFKMSGTTARSSITIEHQFTDLGTAKYAQYTGCKVSGMSLSIGDEGEVLVNIDIVGAEETIASSAFDAAPTEVTYYPLGTSVASLKEGGSTFSSGTRMDLSINFNPDTSKYVIGGGGVLGAMPDGIIDVTGTFESLFENTTLIDKAKDSTESSLEATFTGSADRKVIIEVPELEYDENTPSIDGPQGLLVSLPFKGFYDNNADASSVLITVLNSEAHA